MIRIAIVGDIGSGKSYVAKQFGFPVFNADIEVGRLYKKSKKSFNKLKKVIPKFIISFPIKKSEISKAIMNDNNNLKKIIKIIHPLVRSKMNKFVKEKKKYKIIVLDVPLLFENKINKKNDIIIFVDAKKKEIYKRLKKRQNFNEKIIKKLRKLQLPLEIKKKKADFIIKNNFKNNYIEKNVKIIKKKILLNA